MYAGKSGDFCRSEDCRRLRSRARSRAVAVLPLKRAAAAFEWQAALSVAGKDLGLVGSRDLLRSGDLRRLRSRARSSAVLFVSGSLDVD